MFLFLNSIFSKNLINFILFNFQFILLFYLEFLKNIFIIKKIIKFIKNDGFKSN